METKSEKVKNYIFQEFWPIFGISVVFPQKFTNAFAATDPTTYFQKISIDIFMTKFFFDGLYMFELWAKNPT